MKTTTLIMIAAAIGLSGAAHAEEGKGPRKPHKVPPEILEKFDADKDGKLDEEERKAAKAARGDMEAKFRQEMLEKFDVDGDGKLNDEEKAAMREGVKKKMLEKFDKDGEASSYQGHLVMFPSGYGLYDLYRRNGISGDQDGRAKAAGKQHDWNQMEILAIGSRIRFAVNGKEVLDWTDPKPELCEAGPIGLQLHSNKVPQEVRFRGLVLVEDPTDVLVTASPTP
jgi:hypothetical protein